MQLLRPHSLFWPAAQKREWVSIAARHDEVEEVMRVQWRRTQVVVIFIYPDQQRGNTMGDKFFPDGPTGTETIVYRAFRGYWVGPDREAGFGMQLPSDLVALDEDADQHSTQWGIWRSRAINRFYALIYDPHPGRMKWYGFRLRAKSPAQARLELSEYLDESDK